MNEAEDWQLWAKRPEQEMKCNIERINGSLPEMESTKQLVKLISDVYEPDMKVLDVGCNVGHYLLGLRNKFLELDYTGVDAYEVYIENARKAFSNDPNANFEVKDILKSIYPDDPRDISYCCNVIIHLPDFRRAVTNLLASTKKVCFIRTLLGERTSIVKIPEKAIFDEEGSPLDYYYYNTWEKNYFIDFVKNLGWHTELIEDEFNPDLIKNEYDGIKENIGTTVMNNKQVIGNIICNWVWAKITPINSTE